MSGSEELPREKLVALVEQQTRLIVEQAERIEALQAEVAELKRWLGATRATRSQPPSTSEPAAPQRVRSTARLVLRVP